MAILAALLAGLWFFLLRGDAVAVPNVVGQTQSQAETTIRDAGFTPQATYEWDSSLATGYVVRTDPAAGTKRDKGSTVTIVVSGAGGGTPEQISVPAVTGLQESDATTALTNAGLVPSITRVSDAASAGTVIQQTPTASSNVPSGSTVTLTVSTGPTSTGTTTSPDTTVPDTTETTETETTETTFPDTTGTVESPPDPRGEDAAPFTDALIGARPAGR